MTFWEKRNIEKLCARFWFSFLLVEGPHHLGRKGSKSNNGTRKKSKKNLNETKDMIKHLPGEQLAAVKKEGKRTKTRWCLKSADMMDG